MHRIQKGVDFILFSNLFVSICAAALATETYLLVQRPINFWYIFFVFFSTLFLYNFQRVLLSSVYVRSSASARHKWILERKKMLIVFCILSAVGIAVCLAFIGLRLLQLMIPLGLVSVLYFLPGIHLRKVPAVKALMVALVWSIVTVYAPVLLFGNIEISATLIYLIAERCFFVLALCILFNVRDITHDRLSEVRTIPSLYGIRAGKNSALACLLIAGLFSFLLYQLEVYPLNDFFAVLLSFMVSAALILKCQENSGEYFYLFGIDGLMGLQFLLVLLGNLVRP